MVAEGLVSFYNPGLKNILCAFVAWLHYWPVHFLIWFSLLCCCTVLSQVRYWDISMLHCVLFSTPTHNFYFFLVPKYHLVLHIPVGHSLGLPTQHHCITSPMYNKVSLFTACCSSASSPSLHIGIFTSNY